MIRVPIAPWLLAAVFALAAPVVAADFTAPPTPNHYVTDGAGVLSSATRTTLENQLRAYESATGHQVVVWIGRTTGDVPLETWTTQTADRWKIGRHGHDDGAVLFVFMDDHKIRIEVGYGLESALTDAQASRIIQDQIAPKLRAGDTDAAISAGVAAMLTTISPAYNGVTPPPSSAPADTTISGPAAVILIVVFGLIFAFIIFLVVMQVIGMIRYGYLVMREGSTRAQTDMRRWWFWGGAGFLGGSSSSFGGGGGFDGGFSAGGGSFGGGGASGGW